MKLILLSLLTTLSLNVFADGHVAERILIQGVNPSPLKAGTIQYAFKLYDSQNKKPLSDQDLVESHTKKVHFIAYDASLNEFNHVHPVYDGNDWKVELNLPVNGKYFFWAQGELKDTTEFSVSTQIQIVSGKPAHKVAPLGEKRTATDNLTTIALSKEKLRAGKMSMLTYNVTRTDGKPAVITPYLGANAHVIAVSPGGGELIHVHPMDGSSPSAGMLHATFPTAGGYRVWIQLIDDGVLKTVPLSVTVLK